MGQCGTNEILNLKRKSLTSSLLCERITGYGWPSAIIAIVNCYCIAYIEHLTDSIDDRKWHSSRKSVQILSLLLRSPNLPAVPDRAMFQYSPLVNRPGAFCSPSHRELCNSRMVQDVPFGQCVGLRSASGRVRNHYISPVSPVRSNLFLCIISIFIQFPI